MRHYLNLTNGIEAVRWGVVPDGFVRIQSTACEQKRWGFILAELDYSFLIDLARGEHVVVHDGSQRKEAPRAIYQGLPWIRFARALRWLGKEDGPAFVRGHNAAGYFRAVYAGLGRQDFRRVDYAGRLLATQDVHLEGAPFRTAHDGQDGWFADILGAA